MYGSVPQGWVNGAGRSTAQKVTEERKRVKLMQMLIVCPVGELPGEGQGQCY